MNNLNILFPQHFTDKPGPPKNLKVGTVTEHSIETKWMEPDSDGGSDIIGFLVEMRQAVRRTWDRAGYVDAGEGYKYMAMALTEGQQYAFRVAAENEVGVGEFVEMIQSVTAKSQFGMFICLFSFI